MQEVYENIGEYNLGKKRKVLIVLGDMIPDMISNKNLNSLVTELNIRSRKLEISLLFIKPSYFKVTKVVRPCCTPFYDENSKQKSTSANYNKSSIIYRFWRFYEDL